MWKPVVLIYNDTRNISTTKNNNNKDEPNKPFASFEGSFQTPNTQWSYCEEAFNNKQGDEEMVKLLDICLTNIILRFGYPQHQLDGHIFEVFFNASKYFNIKQYICEQLLNLAY